MPRSVATTRSTASNRLAIQDMKSSLGFTGNNGSDKRIHLTTPLETGIADDLTVGMWALFRKSANNKTLWFDGFNYGSDLGYLFNLSTANKLTIYTGSSAYSSTAPAPLEQWVYVMFEISGSTGNIYLNDMVTPFHTASITRKASGSTSNYYGAEASNSNTMNGCIKDMFAYSGVLTVSQKETLKYGNLPQGVTLNFYHKLNEGAGSVAYDSSGNGNNGTITSGTYVLDTPTKIRKQVNGNLVYNGDFEYAPVVNVATTTGSRWIDGTAGGSATNSIFGRYLVGAGTYSGLFDSSTKYSGSYSLKISTLATASQVYVQPTTGTSASLLQQYAIPVLPSTSYTLTYKMKTNYVSGDSNDGAYGEISEFTGAGGLVLATTGTKVKTTTDWTTYTVTLTTGATTRYAVLYQRIFGHTGSATLIMDAWFDDITLTPTTPITRTAVT